MAAVEFVETYDNESGYTVGQCPGIRLQIGLKEEVLRQIRSAHEQGVDGIADRIESVLLTNGTNGHAEFPDRSLFQVDWADIIDESDNVGSEL